MDNHIKETDVDKEAKHKLANLKRVKARYHRLKNDPEFQAKNKANQMKAYHNNPEYRKKKIDNYYQNKNLHNYRSVYNLHKRQNRLNDFIERHPDKYKFLVNHDRARYEVIVEHPEPHDPETVVAPE